MKTFLKGKLTKLSAAIFGSASLPDLLVNIPQTADLFKDAAGGPLDYVKVISALGIIWGGIRRSLNYFGK